MILVRKNIAKGAPSASAAGAFFAKLFLLSFLSLYILSCSSAVRFAEKRHEPKDKTWRPPKPYVEKPFPKEQYEKELASVNLRRKQAVQEAHGWIGTPYLWGGDTRRGVDCSGLVKNVMREVRISVPRTAAEQYGFAKKVDMRDTRPGDLAFFTNGVGISHVGIYIGAGYVIHASTSNGVIRQSLEDSYLRDKFVSFGRLPLD